MLCFASLALLSGLFFVLQDLATATEGSGSAFHEKDLAVIRFSSPQQFALLLHEPEPAPRLYKVGDLLTHPDDRTRLLEVERIQARRLTLRDHRTGRRWSLQSDGAAPVVGGLVFLGAVSLTDIRYRFEASDRMVREAPVVLSVAGTRAVLKQQVPVTGLGGQRSGPAGDSPFAPGSRGGRATASAGVPSRIGEGTYEVDKSALAPTLNKLSKKLAKGVRDITRALWNRGSMLPVRSSVGDGVLTEGGFTVTEPKVAQTFGIEVGDTIVAVNGKPVSSPLNAYWTFQEVFIRGKTNRLRVDLVRGGRPVTQTYKIK